MGDDSASRKRCEWADRDPLLRTYHDEQWGRPVHDDRLLFEALVLDGAQAGLSWITILRKRDGYRRAFAEFDAEQVARFGAREVERLLNDEGIVRNRAKVESAIVNAKRFLEVQRELGSFDSLLWGFVGGHTKRNRWRSMKEIPAKTPESEAMSAELRRRGFKFVGPTICYALMQACGMVDDHVTYCFRARRGAASAGS
ncbi:MAG: DNA-3-methyladenine glycosylase I [Polyangiaceae bacterium]